jgi:hypothetical protein
MVQEILKQTIVVTGFVMVMMLVIEYLNTRSHGSWSKWLENSPFFQLIFATLLSSIPGCIGVYTVVSLYTHNIVSFGALVAAMIATMGDEALVMYTMIPGTAIKLNIILISIALLVGWLTNVLLKDKLCVHHKTNHFVIHEHHNHESPLTFPEIREQLKNMSFQRFLLIAGHVLFIFALVIGWLDHDHAGEAAGAHDAHEAQGAHNEHGMGEVWVNYIFMALTLVGLFIVSTVSEHFLSEHLWAHIIRKHFLRIFLWTLLALVAIHVLMEFVDLESLIKAHPVSTLFLALAIGIIPISGPHLIFTSLFAAGLVPFSILFANSLVQDGHGALPLFAETKKSFFVMKGIKIAIALTAGIVGMMMGW